MKTKTNLIVQDAMKAVSNQVRLPECVRNGKIKNMTQYKLIKTPEQFIIVSDEIPNKGDIVINNLDNLVGRAIRELNKGEIKDKEYSKIIAQQNQIDFNGFEDIVGYIDVEKFWKEDTKTTSFGETNQYDHFKNYQKGFNKANELSSSKQFTLEDMEYCYNTAKRRAVMQEAGLETDLGFKNYIDTYHQQPKEWMIEIEMEFIPQALPQDRYKPKLINNKIKITKIL